MVEKAMPERSRNKTLIYVYHIDRSTNKPCEGRVEINYLNWDAARNSAGMRLVKAINGTCNLCHANIFIDNNKQEVK